MMIQGRKTDGAMNQSLLIPKQVYPQGLRWWCSGIISCLCRFGSPFFTYANNNVNWGDKWMRASVPAQGKHKQETTGDSWRVEWMKAKITSAK